MRADPRFFEALGPFPARALAPPGAVLRGDADRLIATAAPAEEAEPDAIAYAEGRALAAASARAGALFVSPKEAESAPQGPTLILTERPRAALAAAMGRLFRERGFPPEAARVDPSAAIEEGARLSPGCVVGAEARIGAGAVIGPNAVIGPGVAIGRRTSIGAGASVFCALIGDDVTIGANCAIGGAGFGVAPGSSGPVDIPQLGRAIIMDRASLGALCAVDRGMFEDTIVGEDAKIDNFCHIAHNVVLGRAVIMAAFAGLSGSCRIGDGVLMGGRVGVADHVEIGAGATLAANSAVLGPVPATEKWGGFPAQPMQRWLREVAWLRRAAGKKNE